VSGANDSTPVSGANDPTPVSGANDSTPVSEDSTVSDESPTTTDAPQHHDAPIQIVKGEPTAEELAAVIAVLAAASGTPAEPREQEVNLWGHPVDRLRYSPFSWQRVTLMQRTHMRHR
jgi:hypothetical protein